LKKSNDEPASSDGADDDDDDNEGLSRSMSLAAELVVVDVDVSSTFGDVLDAGSSLVPMSGVAAEAESWLCSARLVVGSSVGELVVELVVESV
jgi:hypothetical protein